MLNKQIALKAKQNHKKSANSITEDIILELADQFKKSNLNLGDNPFLVTLDQNDVISQPSSFVNSICVPHSNNPTFRDPTIQNIDDIKDEYNLKNDQDYDYMGSSKLKKKPNGKQEPQKSTQANSTTSLGTNLGYDKISNTQKPFINNQEYLASQKTYISQTETGKDQKSIERYQNVPFNYIVKNNTTQKQQQFQQKLPQYGQSNMNKTIAQIGSNTSKNYGQRASQSPNLITRDLKSNDTQQQQQQQPQFFKSLNKGLQTAKAKLQSINASIPNNQNLNQSQNQNQSQNKSQLFQSIKYKVQQQNQMKEYKSQQNINSQKHTYNHTSNTSYLNSVQQSQPESEQISPKKKQLKDLITPTKINTYQQFQQQKLQQVNNNNNTNNSTFYNNNSQMISNNNINNNSQMMISNNSVMMNSNNNTNKTTSNTNQQNKNSKPQLKIINPQKRNSENMTANSQSKQLNQTEYGKRCSQQSQFSENKLKHHQSQQQQPQQSSQQYQSQQQPHFDVETFRSATNIDTNCSSANSFNDQIPNQSTQDTQKYNSNSNTIQNGKYTKNAEANSNSNRNKLKIINNNKYTYQDQSNVNNFSNYFQMQEEDQKQQQTKKPILKQVSSAKHIENNIINTNQGQNQNKDKQQYYLPQGVQKQNSNTPYNSKKQMNNKTTLNLNEKTMEQLHYYQNMSPLNPKKTGPFEMRGNLTSQRATRNQQKKVYTENSVDKSFNNNTNTNYNNNSQIVQKLINEHKKQEYIDNLYNSPGNLDKSYQQQQQNKSNYINGHQYVQIGKKSGSQTTGKSQQQILKIVNSSSANGTAQKSTPQQQQFKMFQKNQSQKDLMNLDKSNSESINVEKLLQKQAQKYQNYQQQQQYGQTMGSQNSLYQPKQQQQLLQQKRPNQQQSQQQNTQIVNITLNELQSSQYK